MSTARPDAPKVTATDFLEFPDRFPQPSQLVQGQVVVNEPNLIHARVQGELLYRIRSGVEAESARGEVFVPIDVPINEWNVFAPDISWYSEARRPARGARRVETLPDLAVEVRSPSTWFLDVGRKFSQYQRAGLPELWMVDTKSQTVLVYRRSDPTQFDFDVSFELGDGAVLTSPLLAGLAIAIGELFHR